jgi:hypothetical protein
MSWDSVRKILRRQQRVTASFTQDDGRSLHVRKSTLASPQLQEMYDALGISASPGGTGAAATDGSENGKGDKKMAVP